MADAPAPASRQPRWLLPVLIAVALAAIALPAWFVLRGPKIATHRVPVVRAVRVIPQAEIPPVEPVAFQDLPPDDARAYNDSVPFVDGPKPAARPFMFDGDGAARARATDCLATAVLYEAGNDPDGQRAVAQVVINRARHPAFPKTICGVVFQGSERSTGCQFTFTCDGALQRHAFVAQAWAKAHAIAAAALNGAVDKTVGLATHYHTDWVVPYWQSSLDKLAAVHTHLFFRWTGWWGTPGAFARRISPDEPVIAALAPFSDAHKAAVDVAAMQVPVVSGDETAASAGGLRIDPNSFVLKLDPHMNADAFAAIAGKTCGDRTYCKVMGWTDQTKLPSALPLNAAQVGSMSFSYLRDRAHDFDKALWNCVEFKRTDKMQCMKLQVLAPVAVARPLPPNMPIDVTNAGRKPQPAAMPTPAPSNAATPVAKPTTTADGR